MDKYEKLYNEALERARKIHNEILNNEIIGFPDQIREIFPQLRESEDERIRKWIVSYIHHGVFTEDEHPMALKAVEWLEKQKENPKSADSIPSYCVSDAKCEDRWHKVGDSLPDNPREVLCKDEAGNYFIGRYYVGEGWEISNYDDEDKPHHLNPPVSKWIDFPSEKQKEQKPAEPTGKLSREEYLYQLLIDQLITYSDYEYLTGKKPTWSEDKDFEDCLTELACELYEQRDESSENTAFRECEVLKKWTPILLKKAQQKQEWSEEDEKIVNNIVSVLGQYIDYKAVSGTGSGYATPRYAKEIDWLNSLRTTNQ